MSFELQVVGIGDSSMPPSVVLISDRFKVLFNTGEGAHRLWEEHSIKIGRTTHICYTSCDWENWAGFIDLCFLFEQCQANVAFFGPSGLFELFLASRYFLYCPKLSIKLHEITGKNQEITVGKETRIKPILVFPSDPIPNGQDGTVSEMINPLFLDLMNLALSTTSFGSKEIATEMLEKASKIQLQTSGQQLPRPSAMELSLEFNRPVKFPIPLPSTINICYAIHTSPIPPKFDPKKAMSLGVPKGPLFGKLTSGQSVTLENGVTITPQQCFENEGANGPIALVVTCKDESYENSFYTNPAWEEYYTNPEVLCVVHLSPFRIISKKNYIQWCTRFPPSTQHIFANNEMCRGDCLLTKSQNILQKLNHVDPRVFSVPTPLTACMWPHEANLLKSCKAEFLLKYILQPIKRAGLDRSHVLPGRQDPTTRLTQEVPGLHDVLQDYHDICTHELPGVNSLQPKDVVLHLFGTGAAQPSQVRNVTGMLLNITWNSVVAGMLLDAGSGTYGQMIRKFGADLPEVLANIKCVWISHKHVDHHGGLIAILQARVEALRCLGRPTDSILIIGPFMVEGYLREINYLSNNSFQYNFVHYPDLHSIPNFFEENYGITHVNAIPVLHGGDANALILNHQNGWKIVFSGDTRPSQSLVKAGEGCTLLVHEATMQDHQLGLACGKAHSTTREARVVGQAMGAFRVLMIHFSQRQASFPVQDFMEEKGNEETENAADQSEDGRFEDNPDRFTNAEEFEPLPESQVIIGMDLMSIDFWDLPRLPRLLEALKTFYRYTQQSS